MQETLFNSKFKRWKVCSDFIETSKDSLTDDEQNAITTLKTLWRRETFGTSCKERVERQIKVLIDKESYHGGEKDLKLALKDFRSISKMLYTTDEETFRQFAAAIKKIEGGPQISNNQHQRRQQQAEDNRRQAEQILQQQRQRQQEQQRQQTQAARPAAPAAQRPATSTAQRPIQANQPRQQPSRPPQRPASSGANRTSGGNGGKSVMKWLKWVVILAVVVGVAVVGFKFLGSSSSEENTLQALLQSQLVGSWGGSLNDRQALLSVDSVAADSVFGQMSVKKRRKTTLHDVAGIVTETEDGLMLTLDDLTAQAEPSDELNGNYRLLLDTLNHQLTGNYTDYASGETVSLILTRSDQQQEQPEAEQKNQPQKKRKKQTEKSSQTASPTVEKTGTDVQPKENATPVEDNRPTINGIHFERVNMEDIPH